MKCDDFQKFILFMIHFYKRVDRFVELELVELQLRLSSWNSFGERNSYQATFAEAPVSLSC